MWKRQVPEKKMAEGRGGVPRWRSVEMAQDTDSSGKMAKLRGIEWGTPGERGVGALMAQESVGATAGTCWCG